MGRQYESHLINDVVHRLHPVRSDSKKIGFVPVREVNSIQDVINWIDDDTSGFDEELILSCLTYGVTVHLQRLARESVTGEKFTEAAFNKMYNVVDTEVLVSFHKNAKGLREHLKKMWEERQTTADDIDEDTIHEEPH